MGKRLTIEEAKSLPTWPEMNRFVKHILNQEMEGIDYEIVPFEDKWEVHIEGRKVAEIGVIRMDDTAPQDSMNSTDKTNLN